MTLSMPLFILSSAVLYTVGMIAMKVWGDGGGGPLILLLVFGAVAAGVGLEIEALKTERLGAVYIAMLAAECVLITLASVLFFGETFSTREIIGTATIVIGTAIAWI